MSVNNELVAVHKNATGEAKVSAARVDAAKVDACARQMFKLLSSSKTPCGLGYYNNILRLLDTLEWGGGGGGGGGRGR